MTSRAGKTASGPCRRAGMFRSQSSSFSSLVEEAVEVRMELLNF